jgi:hypothetical protein
LVFFATVATALYQLVTGFSLVVCSSCTGLQRCRWAHTQLLFFGSSDDLEEGLPLAKQLSEQFAGRIICVSVNTDEKASENVIEFFGLSQLSGVTVMGFSVKDEQVESALPPALDSFQTPRPFIRSSLTAHLLLDRTELCALCELCLGNDKFPERQGLINPFSPPFPVPLRKPDVFCTDLPRAI